MNWFVKKVDGTVANDGSDEFCEHLTYGAKYHTRVREMDSFGVVGSYAMCEACAKKAQVEEDNEKVCCRDCKQAKPAKNVTAWTWYDFYAAQGDVAINVCDDCWDRSTHQARMRKDAADERLDSGVPDDDDYYDYDYAQSDVDSVSVPTVRAEATGASNTVAPTPSVVIPVPVMQVRPEDMPFRGAREIAATVASAREYLTARANDLTKLMDQLRERGGVIAEDSRGQCRIAGTLVIVRGMVHPFQTADQAHAWVLARWW